MAHLGEAAGRPCSEGFYHSTRHCSGSVECHRSAVVLCREQPPGTLYTAREAPDPTELDGTPFVVEEREPRSEPQTAKPDCQPLTLVAVWQSGPMCCNIMDLRLPRQLAVWQFGL